jgi:hypothetical protein
MASHNTAFVRNYIFVADVNCRRISGEDFDVVISTAPWPQSAKLAGLSECKNPYVFYQGK